MEVAEEEEEEEEEEGGEWEEVVVEEGGCEVRRFLRFSSRSCLSLSLCFRADKMGKCWGKEREKDAHWIKKKQ